MRADGKKDINTQTHTQIHTTGLSVSQSGIWVRKSITRKGPFKIKKYLQEFNRSIQKGEPILSIHIEVSREKYRVERLIISPWFMFDKTATDISHKRMIDTQKWNNKLNEVQSIKSIRVSKCHLSFQGTSQVSAKGRLSFQSKIHNPLQWHCYIRRTWMKRQIHSQQKSSKDLEKW